MTQTNGVVTERAYAKINLSLHVTGQRADGYHLLDSLVTFTAYGDEITVTPSDHLSLEIEGPFAHDLTNDPDNLVFKAARLFDTDKGAAITLTKNLPVASGIGGGSADAAATLRALARFWNLPIPAGAEMVKLGADVPVCMTSELTRMRGIGEQLDLLGSIPKIHMVLVNPNIAISTPVVFRGLANKTNAPMPETMPDPSQTDAWTAWVAQQRNDLEAPARVAAPEIGKVLNALSSNDGCQLARMSGSGATCFALFNSAKARETAVANLQANHPNWWIKATNEAPV